MTFDKKHKNVILSILLFVFLSLFVTNIQWNSDFVGAGLSILTETIAIGIGLLFIVLRIFKVIIRKTNFLYSYFGVLNLLLGLTTFGIIIYHKKFAIGFLTLLLIQLLIALFILLDIFKKENSPFI